MDAGQARLSFISLLEPDTCFDESHYLLVNDHFHSLRVHGNRHGYLLRTLHLNRLEPDRAFSQEKPSETSAGSWSSVSPMTSC